MDWKKELNSILEGRARVSRAEQENAMFEEFLDKTAVPALHEIASEFTANHGREAKVHRFPGAALLTVMNNGVEEISFRIFKHFVANGILPSAEVRVNRGACTAQYSSMFRPDPQTYPISAVTGEDVITCFIKYYRLVREGGVAR